jgi:hypothetical protein
MPPLLDRFSDEWAAHAAFARMRPHFIGQSKVEKYDSYVLSV